MRSIPNCCKRSELVGTQINPRPCLAMKLTATGETCCAAKIKSPSFSRSASSTTMTSLPFFKSATTASMGSKVFFIQRRQRNRSSREFQPIRLAFCRRECGNCESKRVKFFMTAPGGSNEQVGDQQNSVPWNSAPVSVEKMQRLDRLANLGMLSAGMAHEIKNGMVAIKTFVDLLLEKNQDCLLYTSPSPRDRQKPRM